MAITFREYVGKVEKQAQMEGPRGVAELEAFRAHYALAQKIRALRAEHGLTQKQLSDASGINQTEISRIERGRTNPTALTLAALLAPLGAQLTVMSRSTEHHKHRPHSL